MKQGEVGQEMEVYMQGGGGSCQAGSVEEGGGLHVSGKSGCFFFFSKKICRNEKTQRMLE